MIDFSTQEGETLGDRIRNLRIIHGMSQDDLAKAVLAKKNQDFLKKF